jgi:hypothetical protein
MKTSPIEQDIRTLYEHLYDFWSKRNSLPPEEAEILACSGILSLAENLYRMENGTVRRFLSRLHRRLD